MTFFSGLAVFCLGLVFPSHDQGGTFYTIITTLDELGYDLQWQVLNSSGFGVPQNRERVFIIGHLRGTPRPEIFPFGESDSRTDESQEKGKLVRLNNPTHSNDRVYGTDGVSPTLNTAQGGNRQPFVAMTEKRTEEAKKIRRETKDRDFSPRRGKQLEPRTDDMSNCVTSGQSKESLLTSGSKIRRLTPTECERLQAFPDGWTEGLSDTQRYKTLGNAVTVNVIRDICEKLLVTKSI